MKVTQQNKAFFFGNTPFGNKEMDVKERIAMKKQLHQKEAVRIVSTANKTEKRTDRVVEERREEISRLLEENKEANACVKEYRQKMAQAKEEYGIEDDSQEQKDLELLQKAYDIQKHGSSHGQLTEEEEARLKEMGEMTEYQKLCMEAYGQADFYKTTIERNNLKIAGEAAAVRMIGIERLKEHGMVDAQVAKEKIMAAASDEAIAMMVEDVQKNVDEKAEEIQEAADERKEEKEEEEKRLEAAQADKSESEAAAEAIRENAQNLTQQAVDSEDVMRDVDNEMKKLMQQQKLLEEDLKGLSLDVVR